MKSLKIPSLLLLTIISIGISCCCTKKGCETNLSLPVSFYNYSKNEIDTIEVIRYIKGSNFLNVIDTNLYSTIKDQWTTEDKYDLNETMDHTEDYSIEIKATGKRAYLSVITVDYTRKCNQCFLGIAQDYSPKIKSYKLDDVVQFSSSISIYK